MAAKIINACAAMHNICLERDSDYYIDPDIDDEDDTPPPGPMANNQFIQRGIDNQNFIIQYMAINANLQIWRVEMIVSVPNVYSWLPHAE